MAIDNFFLNDMCVKKVEFMEITEEEGAVFEDVKYIFLIVLFKKNHFLVLDAFSGKL